MQLGTETWTDSSWFGENMADSTSQLKRKQRSSGTDPMMQQRMHDFDVGSLYWLPSVCFRCAVQHLHDSSHSMLSTYFNDVSQKSSSWLAKVGIT